MLRRICFLFSLLCTSPLLAIGGPYLDPICLEYEHLPEIQGQRFVERSMREEEAEKLCKPDYIERLNRLRLELSMEFCEKLYLDSLADAE